MWYAISAVGGILIGYIIRTILASVYAAKHSTSIGVLNVVTIGDEKAEIFLELYNSPEKLAKGRAIVDIVRSRR